MENVNVDVRFVYYYGNFRKKEKEEMFERIKNEDYDIFVISV